MAINRQPIFEAVKQMRNGQPFTDAEVVLLDTAIDAALGVGLDKPQTGPFVLANPAAFFKSLRQALNVAFTQQQVDGIGVLLTCMGQARWPLSWCADGLATAWWETNKQMVPVREAYWTSEAWRRNNLRYYPAYGRGYVQLTWPANYEKADEELGLNGALIADYDKALEPEIAAKIMVRGMEAGWFTGKGLKDFLPLAGRAGNSAYQQARKIINGTDHAADIAKIAQAFENALSEGGWG